MRAGKQNDVIQLRNHHRNPKLQLEKYKQMNINY